MELLSGKRRAFTRLNFSERNLGWLARLGFPKENLGGFTMIELLIVIGIIGIIGTVSLANLVGWRSAKELNSTAQKIATLVREAESRAMSQDRGSSWGVHFEYDGTNLAFFSLFYSDKSGAYNPANEVERYPLPSSIQFNMLADDGTTVLTELLQDVTFDQITGKPRKSKKYKKSDLTSSGGGGGGISRRGVGNTGVTYDYITPSSNQTLIEILSLKQKKSDGTPEKSSVKIDPAGTIAFDSLSCVFTCYVQQVVLLPPPVILSFSAAPTSTAPSVPVTLSWTTVNAESCDGSPWTDSRETNGSATVTPSQTATYSLQCSGGGGQTTADVSVTVEVVPGGGDSGGDGTRGRQQREL